MTRGTPPDWTEPVSLRPYSLLWALGTSSRRTSWRGCSSRTTALNTWPAAVLPQVLHQLAYAQQVVTFFSYRTRRPEYDYELDGLTEAGTAITLDWHLP